VRPAAPVVGRNRSRWDYCEYKLRDYVITLEYGKALAIPYKKWFKGKLPTFFVDDDERLYTVGDLLFPISSVVLRLCPNAF
jgi:hypothetical protein